MVIIIFPTQRTVVRTKQDTEYKDILQTTKYYKNNNYTY